MLGGGCLTDEVEIDFGLQSADDAGDRFAGPAGVGPAQGAVAGVHVEVGDLALTDDRHVARRGRAQEIGRAHV